VPERSVFNGIFMLKPLFAALLLSLPALAQANFLDAYELKARCLSERADAVNTCLGYLSGVADSDNGAPAWRSQKSLFCIPQGVTVVQLRSTLLSYLKQHPEEEDFNAAILVGNAFIEAFPCD
jgi:hypothetical protein